MITLIVMLACIDLHRPPVLLTNSAVATISGVLELSIVS